MAANEFMRGMQIGSALVGQFAPVAKAIRDNRTNDIANRLMNEGRIAGIESPRAEAVNPELSKAMEAGGFGATKPATGGTDELRMRMAVNQAEGPLEQEMKNLRLEQMKQNLSQDKVQHETLYGPKAQEARAQEAINKATSKQREIFADTNAYHKSVKMALNSLNKATSDEEYEMMADEIATLYDAATSRGLKVSIPNMPPPPSVRAAESERQTEIADLESEITKKKGGWGIPDSWQGIPDKEKRLAELQKQGPIEASRQPFGKADPAQVLSEAKAAISAGADPAKVSERLKQIGIDPSLLSQ